jgi:hypothetical protein
MLLFDCLLVIHRINSSAKGRSLVGVMVGDINTIIASKLL